MRDSVIVTNRLSLEDYYASSSRKYVELDDLTGERKIMKSDNFTDLPRIQKTSLYEIIVQCVRFNTRWNNRITPLPKNIQHGMNTSPRRHTNLNIYEDCCPTSIPSCTTINISKVSISPSMKLKDIDRKIEHIPLSTFSLVSKECREPIICKVAQSSTSETAHSKYCEIQENEIWTPVVANPYCSSNEALHDTHEKSDNDFACKEIENRMVESVLENPFTDGGDVTEVEGNRNQNCLEDRTITDAKNSQVCVGIKQGWTVKDDRHSQTAATNDVGTNHKTWKDLLQKMKSHIRKHSQSTRTTSLCAKKTDSWAVAVPTSLSITYKDSDWTSEINDIGISKYSKDIWRHSTPEVYVAGGNDWHTQWRTKKISSSNGFELDYWQITLKNSSDNQYFSKSMLNDVEKCEKLCSKIQNCDWSVSISNIQPRSLQDDLWISYI